MINVSIFLMIYIYIDIQINSKNMFGLTKSPLQTKTVSQLCFLLLGVSTTECTAFVGFGTSLVMLLSSRIGLMSWVSGLQQGHVKWIFKLCLFLSEQLWRTKRCIHTDGWQSFWAHGVLAFHMLLKRISSHPSCCLWLRTTNTERFAAFSGSVRTCSSLRSGTHPLINAANCFTLSFLCLSSGFAGNSFSMAVPTQKFKIQYFDWLYPIMVYLACLSLYPHMNTYFVR